MVEEGHIRVGQALVTDPAYLVSRELSDLITWAPGSKIRQHVRRYNNNLDDFED
jgi:U3 small nucleolar ribonucleoprotein protein IMP3